MRIIISHTVLLLMLLLGSSAMLNATTHWVINTNDAGPGSFRDAVVNASLGDTVRIDSMLLAGGSDTIHLMSTVFMPAPLVFKGIYSDVDSIYISGEGNVFPLASAWTGTQYQGENILLDSMFIINAGGGGSVSAFSTVFIDSLQIFNSAFMFNDAGATGFAAAVKAQSINVLHIKNSKFRNNIAGYEYSNIYCTGKNLVIEQSSFFNGAIYQGTSSLSDGYTIYFDASNDTVSVDMVNVNFYDNQGGGIWLDVDGFLDLSIQDVTLDSNDCDGYDLFRATSSGFLVQVDGWFIRGNSDAFNTVGIGGSPLGSVFLSNAWIEGNTSLWSNFSTSGSMEVNHSDFIANEATSSTSDGGAIRAGEVSVDASSFVGNSCGDKGGAIYASRNVAITNTSFINNTTDESSFANGGAVYCFGDFTATNSTFKANQAYDGGVVKCLGDSVTFSSCTVDSNKAANDGAVAHLIWNDSLTGDILIDSSDFQGNRALGGGGVLHLESGVNTDVDLTVTESAFLSNHCYDEGGVFWLDAERIELDVSDASFNHNQDTIGGSGAIGLFGNQFSSIALENVDFIGNEALGAGAAGAMNVVHNGLQNIQIQSINADSNSSKAFRFAATSNPTVQITDASFIGNSGQPGALWLDLPNLTGFATVDSCTFLGNSSNQLAAGLWAKTRLHITNTTLSANTCTQVNNSDAGGMFVEGTVVMENCVVNNNTASSGAGVYVKDADSIRLSNVTFDGNAGTLWGGGLYVDPSVLDVTINECDFIGNSAELGGGVYMDLEVGASISNCLFKQNTATEDGGGLYARSVENVTWSFTDSTRFIGNEADRDGGAVCMRHVTTNPGNIFASAHFSDTRLDSNTAGRNGGAIALSAFQSFNNTATDHARGVIEIKRSKLAHNEVTGLFPQFMTGSGGAVSMLGSDTLILEVDSTRMSWNEAFDRGGAVYMRASRSTSGKPSFAKASIDASTLDHNSAQITGAALAVIAFHNVGSNAPTVAKAELDAYRSSIVHNTGSSFGSALFASAGNGSVFSGDKNKIATTRLEASTVAFNTGNASTTEILNWSGFYSSAATTCKSSLVGMNGGDSNYVSTIGPAMISQGYNAFDSLVSNHDPQLDLYGLDSSGFDLEPLAMNGGLTPTMLPGANSLVVNGGDPQNLDPAQNGAIVYQRDRGAAESNGCQYLTVAALEGCDSLYWAPADTTFLSAVNDTFYFNSTLNCDSAVLLNVQLGSSAYITEIVDTCGSFTWLQTGLTYDSSGVFHDTVSSVNGCDSIFTLDLTVQTLDTDVDLLPGGLSAAQTQAVYQWIDCSTDSLLLGQDEQAFFPTTTGSFKVALAWQGCADTSDCYTVVGLVESKHAELQVYPNPFVNRFNVWQTHPQSLQLEVYDALGALVYRTVSTSDQYSVDASSWAPGVYVLVLKDTSGQSETRRLIKR